MEKKNGKYIDIKVLGKTKAVLRFVSVGLSFDGTEGYCSTEFGKKNGTQVMKGCVYGRVSDIEYRKLRKFMDGEEYMSVEDETRD